MKKTIIDLHQDIALYERIGNGSQTNLKDLYDTVDIVVGSVFVEPSITDEEEINKQITEDIEFYRALEYNKDTPFRTILTSEDVDDVLKKGKRGIIIHLEGADTLRKDTLPLLDEWYRDGLRSLGLVWNNDNAIGTSAASKNKSNVGITEFGEQLIKECDARGILIDCAHLNDAGFFDVARLSQRAPYVSHGNARSLCNTKRNLSDEQLQLIKEKEGLVGVFFSGPFIAEENAKFSDVVNQVEYLIQKAGEGNVSLGSDFGGITSGTISDIDSVKSLPGLCEAVSEEGISGENAQRFLVKNLTKS